MSEIIKAKSSLKDMKAIEKALEELGIKFIKNLSKEKARDHGLDRNTAYDLVIPNRTIPGQYYRAIAFRQNGDEIEIAMDEDNGKEVEEVMNKITQLHHAEKIMRMAKLRGLRVKKSWEKANLKIKLEGIGA